LLISFRTRSYLAFLLMLANAIPTQFGKAEFWREFDHDGRLGLVVVEMWRGNRWIVLYYRQEQFWIVSSRYIVCRPDGPLARIHQEYAPRIYYGASVDGDGSYIVVKREDRVWLLSYDIDMDYCGLLDVVEIPSLDIVVYPVDQYLDFLLEGSALIQLRNVVPTLASVCEVYLIDTVNSRIAYMVEDTGFSRRLFWYVWVGESWHREGLFDAVDRERRRDVRSRITDISDVYEGRVALDTIRIVVEEGVILRWWHISGQ
jgi:hypothetical protein